MNQDPTQPEIIPDTATEEDIILPGSDTLALLPSITPETGRFHVLPHLVLLGLILFGLFSTIVIPKTLSYLQYASVTPPPAQPSIVTEPVSTSVNHFANLRLSAEAVHVWDISKQQALYTKNAEAVYPLASITKLMTALVAYELVADDTLVTISPAAERQESGGWFMAGERYKAKELTDFALISSYNSAAYTLADSIGALLGNGDPVQQFVAAMNIRAEELGLGTMTFHNPTGLDVSSTLSGGYGSATEVNRLIAYIVTHYPEILLPTIKPTTRLYNTNGDYHDATNTNDLVTDIPNLLGSKTGFTDLAGGNLTIVFDAGYNRYIAATVLGSTRNERFTDMQQIVSAVQATVSSSDAP